MPQIVTLKILHYGLLEKDGLLAKLQLNYMYQV